MQARLFAFLAFLLMMIQESTSVEVSLTTKTVVGNILHEHMAIYALALIMLIAAIMI